MHRPSLHLLTALACLSTVAHAENTLPYTIPFQDSAVQAPVRKAVRDNRIDSDPQSWGYVDTRVVERTQGLESRYGIKARHAFSHVLKGFSADLTDSQVVRLRADPTVMAIEEDQPMKAIAQLTPWGITRSNATLSSTLAGNGSGSIGNVNVYVIDTGIATHPDLNLVRHVNLSTDRKNTDCNGHGTHVAGTIGAKMWVCM